MLVQKWGDTVLVSLQNVWASFYSFIPSLIGALVVFIFGLIIATALSALIERILKVLKIDEFLRKLGLTPYFERANLKINSGRFFGQLVFWFLTIAFLLAASDVLGFYSLSSFLKDVLLYIPNIIIAVAIILASAVLGNFLRGIVTASVMSAGMHHAKFLGSLAGWSSIIFGFLTALVQLGIAVSIINTIITGIIAMFALAGGIAFGLGGKDYATHLLGKFRERVER